MNEFKSLMGALSSRMRLVTIRPSAPMVETRGNHQGVGIFCLVNDDPDTVRDASLGPDAFNKTILQAYLNGSQVIVASAVIDDTHVPLLGALVAMSPNPHFVLILTQPQHHGLWTRRVTAWTGQPPIIHIATEDARPEDWGVPTALAAGPCGVSN